MIGKLRPVRTGGYDPETGLDRNACVHCGGTKSEHPRVVVGKKWTIKCPTFEQDLTIGGAKERRTRR